MRPLVVIALAAAALAAGCTSDGSDTGSSTSPTAAASPTAAQTVAPPSGAVEATAGTTAEGTQFGVEPLGLMFRLPDSFGAIDDADYAFLARSMSPRSVFTISEDSPQVTDHASEPGESVSELDFGTVGAVVVADAVLEGLPAGISANELLVSNGDQSFSVIMSAETADLSELWDVFIHSVAVTPAD